MPYGYGGGGDAFTGRSLSGLTLGGVRQRVGVVVKVRRKIRHGRLVNGTGIRSGMVARGIWRRWSKSEERYENAFNVRVQ